MQITGLTEQRIRRTNAWKDHEDQALVAYLSKHPDAETPDIEQEFGFSPPKTVGMKAWRDHKKRKDDAKPPPKIKERPLSDAALTTRPDERAVDPSKPVETRDTLFRAILENADGDTRGQLNRLSTAQRDALLDNVVKTCDINETGGETYARKLEILLEVTRSWLEDQEQERRRSGQRGQSP
jgi:hypothetical protein